jgi:hypothetical protein
LGVLSVITGRTVAWLQGLKALGVVVEDDRYVLGYLHEVKSTRGGHRMVIEGSDEEIMDKLDREVYKSLEEKESGVLDYREGRPVAFDEGKLRQIGIRKEPSKELLKPNGDLERYSDQQIAECLDRMFYNTPFLLEEAIRGFREGLKVKMIKSLEE